MIDLQVLSGKKAGSRVVVGHFPFQIGRAPQNDLPLEDDGVWDRHLTLEFQEKDGFHAVTTANAIATVNGKQVDKSRLHNGDIITVGSAKLQFWLAPAPQRSLSLRENLVWGLLILITAGQFILIFAFLH
jgi:pSer/pThr/pTyr-binding forkhead associated (FHA) protein